MICYDDDYDDLLNFTLGMFSLVNSNIVCKLKREFHKIREIYTTLWGAKKYHLQEIWFTPTFAIRKRGVLNSFAVSNPLTSTWDTVKWLFLHTCVNARYIYIVVNGFICTQMRKLKHEIKTVPITSTNNNKIEGTECNFVEL